MRALSFAQLTRQSQALLADTCIPDDLVDLVVRHEVDFPRLLFARYLYVAGMLTDDSQPPLQPQPQPVSSNAHEETHA